MWTRPTAAQSLSDGTKKLLLLTSTSRTFCFTVKPQNCSEDYNTSPDFFRSLQTGSANSQICRVSTEYFYFGYFFPFWNKSMLMHRVFNFTVPIAYLLKLWNYQKMRERDVKRRREKWETTTKRWSERVSGGSRAWEKTAGWTSWERMNDEGDRGRVIFRGPSQNHLISRNTIWPIQCFD